MATELNVGQKKVMEKLHKLYGEEFDRVFMEEIVQAQLGAIAEFEKTAAKAADADIKGLRRENPASALRKPVSFKENHRLGIPRTSGSLASQQRLHAAHRHAVIAGAISI